MCILINSFQKIYVIQLTSQGDTTKQHIKIHIHPRTLNQIALIHTNFSNVLDIVVRGKHEIAFVAENYVL